MVILTDTLAKLTSISPAPIEHCSKKEPMRERERRARHVFKRVITRIFRLSCEKLESQKTGQVPDVVLTKETKKVLSKVSRLSCMHHYWLRSKAAVSAEATKSIRGGGMQVKTKLKEKKLKALD